MVDFTLEQALAKRAEAKAALLALEGALDGAFPHKTKHLHILLGECDQMGLAMAQEVFGPFAMPADGDPKPGHP